MKKDIKYIIKRVVVGVLIAIIFASINKCNAYAQTINVKLQQNNPPISFPQSTSGLYSLFELDSPYSSNKYNYYSLFNVSENNKYYAIFYDSTKDIYLYLIFNNFANYNNLDFSKVNIVQFTDLGTTSYVYQFYNNQTNEFQTMGGLTYGFILSDNEISDFTDVFVKTNPTKFNSPITGEYFYTNGSQPILSENIFDNFTLYDTNLSELYIDNVSIDFLPSNFESIELNDYQAVYFVPKNYSTTSYIYLPEGCSQNDDVCEKFYEFHYYYQGSIKYSPISIENTNIYLYSKISSDYNADEITYRENYFPYSDGVNYYYVPLIQNGNYTKVSYVYYDTTLFDYYIVDDMTNYSQHLCFIGKDDVELCIDFTLNKTLEDYWQQGLDAGGNSFNEENQDFKGLVGAIFGIFSAPFDFLKKISNGSCSSFNIPIPFTNSNISINCLSPIFKRILGNFFSTFQLLLSGLIVYRITILNFYCINDIMMLKSDKVEVVDL